MASFFNPVAFAVRGERSLSPEASAAGRDPSSFSLPCPLLPLFCLFPVNVLLVGLGKGLNDPPAQDPVSHKLSCVSSAGQMVHSVGV